MAAMRLEYHDAGTPYSTRVLAHRVDLDLRVLDSSFSSGQCASYLAANPWETLTCVSLRRSTHTLRIPHSMQERRLRLLQTSDSALSLECKNGCAMQLICIELEKSQSFNTRTRDPIFAQSSAPVVHSPCPGWSRSRSREYA